jgi:hypothetical protein
LQVARVNARFNNPITQGIARFVDSIGIRVHATRLEQPTFLPGVTIDRGELYVDEPRLASAGDVLHEAGHLAVMTPQSRRSARGNLAIDPGEEMAAIAWSWAALVRIGLEPQILFHSDGYRGQSAALIENFSRGRYIAVPLLAWFGMIDDELSYPSMRTWLRRDGDSDHSALFDRRPEHPRAADIVDEGVDGLERVRLSF